MCMATRTVTVKEEAYERLRGARRYPKESFSEVILRASWPENTVTAGDLLELLRASEPSLDPKSLDRIDALKKSDAPPEDKWAED